MGGALSLRDFCSFENPTLLHCVDVYFALQHVLRCFFSWQRYGFGHVWLMRKLTTFHDVPKSEGSLQCTVWHRHREGCTIYVWSCTIAWSTTWRWNEAQIMCHVHVMPFLTQSHNEENVLRMWKCRPELVHCASWTLRRRSFMRASLVKLPLPGQIWSNFWVMCSHVFTFHRQVSDLAKLQHCNNWSQRHTAPRGTTVAWCWMGFGLVHGHPSFSNQATRWRGIHVCIRANCDVLVAWEYHTCGNMADTIGRHPHHRIPRHFPHQKSQLAPGVLRPDWRHGWQP
jgi:hypothetical protein